MAGVAFVPHFIDGSERGSLDGGTFPDIDPWTRATHADIALGDERDVEAAIGAARRAFDDGPWPRMSERERAEVLRRLADVMDQHADDLALADTLDMGRPLSG